MGNFIHEELVQKLKLPIIPRPKPLNLHAVQGSKFHQVTTQCTIEITTQHGHTEHLTLDIAPIGKHDIILGLPWLKQHKPIVNWQTHNVEQWSLYCHHNCFPTTLLAEDNDEFLVQILMEPGSMPTRTTPGAAGLDLRASEKAGLKAGQRIQV